MSQKNLGKGRLVTEQPLKVGRRDLLKGKIGWGKHRERARRGECCLQAGSLHCSVQGGQLGMSGNKLSQVLRSLCNTVLNRMMASSSMICMMRSCPMTMVRIVRSMVD